MARGKQTPKGVRAAAIAALLAGQGVTEVAKAYDLNESTIRGFLSSREFAKLRDKNVIDFGKEIQSTVLELLKMVQAQAKHGQDPEWLMRQPASDLAVMMGVGMDKAVRILEAAERAQGPAEEENGLEE